MVHLPFIYSTIVIFFFFFFNRDAYGDLYEVLAKDACLVNTGPSERTLFLPFFSFTFQFNSFCLFFFSCGYAAMVSQVCLAILCAQSEHFPLSNFSTFSSHRASTKKALGHPKQIVFSVRFIRYFMFRLPFSLFFADDAKRSENGKVAPRGQTVVQRTAHFQSNNSLRLFFPAIYDNDYFIVGSLRRPTCRLRWRGWSPARRTAKHSSKCLPKGAPHPPHTHTTTRTRNRALKNEGENEWRLVAHYGAM